MDSREFNAQSLSYESRALFSLKRRLEIAAIRGLSLKTGAAVGPILRIQTVPSPDVPERPQASLVAVYEPPETHHYYSRKGVRQDAEREAARVLREDH